MHKEVKNVFTPQPMFSFRIARKLNSSLVRAIYTPKCFLSEVEKSFFEIPSSDLKYSNMSREEWQAVRSLADDRSIVINKTDRGSVAAVWDRHGYLLGC